MLTQDNFPQTLRTDLRVRFEEGRRGIANAEWRQLVETETSGSNSKIIVFYGDKGRLRRLRGERQPQIWFEYKMNANMDEWEYTETVKSTVLDDDPTGFALKKRVGTFADALPSDLQKSTETYLRKGTSYKCFDTNQFFGRNHVYTDTNGATHGTLWTNLNVGGSQVATSTVQAMQNHFAKLKSDRDTIYGAKLTHLGVRRGSANAVAAKEIANSTFTVDVSTAKGQNTTNVFNGSYGIIEMDYGIGDSEWYAFDLSTAAKPLIVLKHTTTPSFDNLEYTALLEDSDTGFMRKEFMFGVYGRFDWNPGDPRTAVLNGTTTWTDPEGDDFERQRIVQPNA